MIPPPGALAEVPSADNSSPPNLLAVASSDTFKDFPEKPEDAGKFYKLPENMLPEGVKLPDGTTFQPNQQLLAAALPILHKHRLPADAFQDIVRAFNGYEVAQYEADKKFFVEDERRLGANAAAIRADTAARIRERAGDKAKLIDLDTFIARAPAGVIEFMRALLENDPPTAQSRILDRWYGGR